MSIPNAAHSARMKKDFPILSINRSDLEELGYDATNLDDEMMQVIAGELAEESIEQMFSGTLDWVAEQFDIPKKGKRKEDELIKSTLRDAHSTEMRRRGATGSILGFYDGPTKLESKTDQGILLSEINPETKKVSHTWNSAESGTVRTP